MIKPPLFTDNTITIQIGGYGSSPVWIPPLFSANIIDIKSVGARKVMTINLTETQKILFDNTVDFEFDCYTKPEYYPYDDIICNLHLNSRHGVKLKWKQVTISTFIDQTESFVLRNNSIEYFESEPADGRNSCVTLGKSVGDEMSCLNLHFHLQRNNGYFDWMFYLPTFTLPMAAYVTFYFSTESQTLRILVCVLVMVLILSTYFIFDLFVFTFPTTATNMVIPIELWFLISILFSFVILTQYILSYGKTAFDIWYVEYYYQLQHYTDKIKINDAKWNNAKRSTIWNFVRWVALQVSNVFVKSTEDFILDIISRLFYLLVLIGFVSYFMFIYKTGIINNLNIDDDVCGGFHRKFNLSNQINSNKSSKLTPHRYEEL